MLFHNKEKTRANTSVLEIILETIVFLQGVTILCIRTVKEGQTVTPKVNYGYLRYCFKIICGNYCWFVLFTGSE